MREKTNSMTTCQKNTARCGIKSRICKVAAIAALAAWLAPLGACQDHHYVPYGKVKDHPEIGQPEAAPKQASAPDVTIVSGKVTMADEFADQDFTGWTLYVITRPKGDDSLLAAIKAENFSFPHEFTIAGQDIMAGDPSAKLEYIVEARLDADGDPMTKEPGDLYGISEAGFPLGATDAVVELNTKRE